MDGYIVSIVREGEQIFANLYDFLLLKVKSVVIDRLRPLSLGPICPDEGVAKFLTARVNEIVESKLFGESLNLSFELFALRLNTESCGLV